MDLTKPIIYLVIATAIIGGIYFYGHTRYNAGTLSERAVWTKAMDLAKAEADQRTTQLQHDADAHEAAHVVYLEKQIEDSNATTAQLQQALANTAHTRVPGAAVRVLNDAEHTKLPKNAKPSSEPSTATVTPDSTLEEQLTICQRNYQERYLPLADQLTQLQKLWVETQNTINKE